MNDIDPDETIGCIKASAKIYTEQEQLDLRRSDSEGRRNELRDMWTEQRGKLDSFPRVHTTGSTVFNLGMRY